MQRGVGKVQPSPQILFSCGCVRLCRTQRQEKEDSLEGRRPSKPPQRDRKESNELSQRAPAPARATPQPKWLLGTAGRANLDHSAGGARLPLLVAATGQPVCRPPDR